MQFEWKCYNQDNYDENLIETICTAVLVVYSNSKKKIIKHKNEDSLYFSQYLKV